MASQTSYTYTLSSLAYTLPLLHAARYFSHTVIGIFLGRIEPDSKNVLIEDALPLIHHYTSLSPMMEVAMELSAAAAKERGLEVVGLYVVPKNEQTGLGRVGERVLGEMKAKFEGAFALVVDNDKFGNGQVPYVVYTQSSTTTSPQALSSSSSPLPAPFNLDPTTDLPAKTLRMIREHKVHRGLNDFDDHLGDSSVDWLNCEELKGQITKYLS